MAYTVTRPPEGERGVWARVIDSLRSFWLGEIPSRDPALAQYFGGRSAASGVSVSEWTALNYSAYWAGVQSIAGTIASLPLFPYKRLPNGGREIYTRSRLFRLLHHEFNPEMSSMVARETMQAHCLTWGNAYAEIERNNNNEPIAIWPITPDRVLPDRALSGALVYRVRALGSGPEVIVPAADMLHIPGIGWDGLMGYSVIRKAREGIGLALAAEQYGALFFGNGAWPGIIAQHPGKLSQEAHKRLKDSLNEAVVGVKAHSLIVTEEGIKVEKVGIPPDDAQFLATRQFQVVEIARWLNMPPHKLRDLTHATFSNIEEQNIDWVKDTLRPWFVKWEHELNRKLIPMLEWSQFFTAHEDKGLMRGAEQARSNFYTSALGQGWMNVNEVRRLENMNPIGPEGDVYLVPLNMQPLSMAEATAEANVQAKTAPPVPAALPEPTPASNGTGRQAQLIAAHRGIMLEVVGRMIRKEANSARRAAKTGPGHLRAWCDAFYPDHTETIAEALTPAMHAHLIQIGSTGDARAAARDLALASAAQSRARLSALLVKRWSDVELAQGVEAEVARWELERPAWIADQILTEELTHALTA